MVFVTCIFEDKDKRRTVWVPLTNLSGVVIWDFLCLFGEAPHGFESFIRSHTVFANTGTGIVVINTEEPIGKYMFGGKVTLKILSHGDAFAKRWERAGKDRDGPNAGNSNAENSSLDLDEVLEKCYEYMLYSD